MEMEMEIAIGNLNRYARLGRNLCCIGSIWMVGIIGIRTEVGLESRSGLEELIEDSFEMGGNDVRGFSLPSESFVIIFVY